MKNNKKIKIILPIVIVLVLVGMYFIKNNGTINYTNKVKSEDSIDKSEGEFALLIESGLPDLEGYAKKGLPVIIDYGSDTCAPCRLMAPEFESFHDKMVEKAFVKYVDIDLNREAAKEVPIQVIPTQVFYNADGTPFEPSEEIMEKYNFQVYNHNVTKKHLFTIHQGFLSEEQLLEISKEMGVQE
ncbi:MAG: thioredoxin family protein [Lagierella massiliensis]|nr:thioredoxin family protein [Lagierella massiliensis]